MEKVNIFAGRFQPFHKGHLQCCKDAFEKNGLQTVIMFIHNDKFDKKKPFSDELIKEELELVKRKEKCIKDIVWLRFPQPVRICRILKDMGYEAALWLAGEDRIESYRKQLNNTAIDKIENELEVAVPELYQTERYGSATAVRNAIAEDDFVEFKKLMPNGTDVLYDKFKEQYSQIKESYMTLEKFIKESLI